MPAYPPPHDTWAFPPPEVSPWWKWLAVLTGIAGLVVTGVLATVLVVVGSEDFPGIIDDQDLLDSIGVECSLMTATIESMPISGSRQRQAETIADQDRSIEVMVAAIRADNPEAITSDQPAEEWLRDWERLVAARETYAAALLRSPDATWEVPLDPDGDEVTERMDAVWLGDPVCEVPPTLTSPSTDALSDA